METKTTGLTYSFSEQTITGKIQAPDALAMAVGHICINDKIIINGDQSLQKEVFHRYNSNKSQLKTVVAKIMTAKIKYIDCPNNPEMGILTGLEWVNQ